ncbi:MAG: hypothetical protein VB008_01235 [Candidatus Elulimicrobiales bacterium]|nr:hypothetical protein [Candidatus Elulimicrobiales bacterium]
MVILLIIYVTVNLKTVSGKIINILSIEMLDQEKSKLYLISSELFESLSDILNDTIPTVAILTLDIELPNKKIITVKQYYKVKEMPKIGDTVTLQALLFFTERKILMVL